MKIKLGDLVKSDYHPSGPCEYNNSYAGYPQGRDVGRVVVAYDNYLVIEIANGWPHDINPHYWEEDSEYEVLPGHPKDSSGYFTINTNDVVELVEVKPPPRTHTEITSREEISNLGKWLSNAGQYTKGPEGETGGPSGLSFL